MVRAPCCEKMGLKRGPWTTEEDRTLINYIQQYGHGNWRALPKQAGLLRCGKSCRLRWTNYLRPDIKRGNFSQEEEETIIKLHEMLGNRWSTIAARLPGRTDNEIKNVWHTHLKKRLKQQQNQEIPETKHQYSSRRIVESKCDELSNSNSSSNSNSNSNSNSITESEEPGKNLNQFQTFENQSYVPVSPQQSSSELSSSSGTEFTDSSETFPSFDESFWADVLPEEHLSVEAGLSGSNIGDTDYWYNLFMKAGEELLEVPDF